MFTRVVESLPGYELSRGCFRAWLYGIARHACADFWRRHGDAVELPLDDLLAPRAMPEPQPETEDGRLKEWALALMGALPPQ